MTTDPLQPDRSPGAHPPLPEMRAVPEAHEVSAMRVIRVLREGPRHRVSLAEAADGSRVVLKQLRAGQAHASARLRLQREQRMLALAQGPFVPRLLALQLDAPEPTLVLAVAEGEPLSTLANAGLAAADVLAIAHQAALALQGIHRAGVLHLDLSPHNLLWSAAARQLTVVDFSSAMLMQGEEANTGSPLGSEGTLPCMSPEQAGLMNRPVDKRSDLYSLGITLYTLAAGRGPFTADDALGWAHAHLTARPEPLASHRPDLPAAFCAVLHRLIAKSPDERYQTAWGLAHDLALCRDAWQAGAPFAELELGRRDVSDHLNGSPGLHGREREVALLAAAWQRAAAGSAELLLIAGDAGIGKTSLVQALRPAVAARGGLFVAGKFDALGQSLPYSALVAALAAWVDQRLADGGALRAGWRAALDAALAPDQPALCGLLPRLSLLLGPQAEPPALDARGTERRLQRAVAALLGVICSEGHPLLWVIDDLQWADPGSLALLQSLVAAGLPPCLMLVVLSRATPAERDEPGAEPLLRRASAEAGRPLQALALPPLDAAASAALVRDILRAPAEREAELAAEVYARTAGNPFAVASLLAHLRGAEVLSFDPDRLRWDWRPHALAALDASEGMVGLLLQQAARLPAETARLLGVGACMGREFGLADIAVLASVAPERGLAIAAAGAGAPAPAPAAAVTSTATPAELDAVEAALQPACAARFLVQRLVEGSPGGTPDGSAAAHAAPHLVYRFVHDRVQEMAQGLLADRERRAVHDRIGRALWAGGASGDALFTAVNHLNLGIEPQQAGPQPDPRREALAALNLRATLLAQVRGAIGQALTYAEAGLALAPADPAVRHPLAVHAHRLCTDLSRWSDAARHYARLVADPAPLLDMAAVHRNQMFSLMGTPDYRAVARIGLDFAAVLGVQVSLDSSPENERALYAEYREAWRSGALARLLDDPPAGDPLRAAAAFVLSASAFSYHEEPPMVRLLGLQALRLLWQNGPAAARWELYEQACRIHVDIGGDYRAGFDEWPFWLALFTRHGNDAQLSQLWFTHTINVLHWNRPLGEVLDAARHATSLVQRWSNKRAAAGLFKITCSVRLESGEPLPRYDEEAERGCAAADRSGLNFLRGSQQVFRQVSRVLQGLTRARWCWDDEGFSLEAMFAEQPYVGVAHMHYWHFELELAVLSHRPERAAEALAQARPLLHQFGRELLYGMHVYYGAMALALQPEPDAAQIAARRQQLEHWALSAPGVYAAKAALLRAEEQRIAGRLFEAVGAYEQALHLAEQLQCHQGVALAAQRLARLCLGAGWDSLAQGALARARSACRAWGALALLEALDDEFGPAPLASVAGDPSGVLATGSGSGGLEFEAVLKAAQSITGELDHARLPGTLIHTLMQYAGADHAVLLMAIGERLEISAAAHTEPTPTLAPTADSDIAWSAVRFARQTGETLLLDDPQRDSRFQDDPYLRSVAPRSLLCLPVRKQQGELLGLIYLENRSTAHAFSHQRLRVLHILVGHVIAALDNARLVHDLRESRDQLELKVLERTRELEAARQVAEDATRAKGDFLANMSHEIRTPMNAILGMTHLALNSGLNARQENYLRKTEQAAQSLLGLIGDILDFSKVEAGKLDMERVAFPTEAVFEALADLLGARARDKGLALRLALAPDLPDTLVGDPLRLRQVLLNLVGNAIKFTEAGEVVVRAALAERNDEAATVVLRFEVQDSGIGMNADQRAGLFQPFVQAESSTARRYGGTGLGLAISQQLVALMGGGLIEVECEAGRGSRFHFSARFGLPAPGQPALAVGTPPAGASPAERRARLRGAHVLLVEDNEINQELACELLGEEGLVVSVAQDGREALALLAAQPFDLVLMDCQMPVMDGYEATRAIRRQPRWQHLPIIAMTANAMAGDREKAIAAGMNDHIAKPIDVAAMFETLMRWLPQRALPASG